MQAQEIELGSSVVEPWFHRPWARVAGVGALLLLLGTLVPFLMLLAGVLLLVAVGLHAGLPELRPYLDHVLRIPVEHPRRRRTRLLLRAGAGLLLVLAGTVGATVRGHLGSRAVPVETLDVLR